MLACPTSTLPPDGSRAAHGAYFKLDAPPILCHLHHDGHLHSDTTLPTSTAITHDDRLRYLHSRFVDRESESKPGSKTLSENDAGGNSPGHTNSCHESIAAGSKADASKPSLSADTPSPSARGHLLSKLPFPRRCQHPDTAPQPVAVSKHDDMVPDAAIAAIESQVYGSFAQPDPLSCPSLPSSTPRLPATSLSSIADMTIATLATLSTHTFTAPVLSSFTSASTSAATPQQRDERSIESASVGQHAQGYEHEHDASELKYSNERNTQGLHATPSTSTVRAAAQVRAEENAGHPSLAIVDVEEWSRASSGGGRSQSRATQARQGQAVSRSLDGHVGFSRSPSRRTQQIQYVRYNKKEDEDDGTSDSAAEDVDDEDGTEYSGAEAVESDLDFEDVENSISHEDAHTQEELEELQDGPPSALPPPLPPKGTSYARGFPHRPPAGQIRTQYSVSDPGHASSAAETSTSALVPARTRTMPGYVSAHQYYSSRRASWASVKQDVYPTMETILRSDDTSSGVHGRVDAEAGPSGVYTQVMPMRRPMFYGANVSSTSAIGSEAAVGNGIVFPRKGGPASFSQSTLHTPLSMSEEDFRSTANWTTMSLTSATSNGKKRRRNKLRKPPPERVLQTRRRKNQASDMSMEENVTRWRTSYIVDGDDPFPMLASMPIMRRAQGTHDKRHERPLSDTAVDYGQTYDAYCNDALYEFPPQSPAEPGDMNPPQQGGKGKDKEGGRRLSVTFEDQGLKVEEHGHVCGRTAPLGSSGTTSTLGGASPAFPARRDLLELTGTLPDTHYEPSSSSLPLPLPPRVPQPQPLVRPAALPAQQQSHLLHLHNGYMRPQLSVHAQTPGPLNRSATHSSSASMSATSPASSRSGSKASSTIASAASTAPTSPGLSEGGQDTGFITLDGEGEGKEYFVGVKAGGEEPKAPILEVRTVSSLVGDGKMKGKRGKLVKKRPAASVVSLAVSVSMEKQKEEKEEEPITTNGARASRNMLGIRFSSLSERGKNGRSICARDGELRDSDPAPLEMLPPIRPPSPLWAGCGSVLLSPYSRFSSRSQAQPVDPILTPSKAGATATETDALSSLAFTGNTGMSSSALAALTSRLSQHQRHTLNGVFDLTMSPAEEKSEGDLYDPYAELGYLRKGKGKERKSEEHDASRREHGPQRGTWATTTLARKAKELGRRSSLSPRKLDEHKPGLQAISASKSVPSSGPVTPIPSPTYSRPAIPRRRSKTLSLSHRRNFSIRRWTLAMADVPDEVLVQELERIRLEGRGRRKRAASSQGHGQTSAAGQKEPDEKAFVYGGPGCASVEASGSSCSHGRDDDMESIASDSTDSHSHEHGGETDEREDAEWKTARKALLCCRELVRTERSYQSKLRQLLAGETATPPSALILTYVPALLSASEALLARLEDDPSAWGVSAAFVAVEEELESAFVAWCGVVGEIFIGHERDETENDRPPRRVSTSVKIAEDNGGTWGLRKRSRSGVSVGRMESIYRKRATSYVESEPDAGNFNGLGMFTAALGTGLAYGISPPTASSNQQDEIVMKTRRSRQATSNASGPLLSRTLSSWKRVSLLSSSGSLVQSSPSSPSAVHASPTQKEKRPSVRELAIQPTQRIMRYVLQYRDLLENTPIESPSRGLVERAFESATRIAGKCDRAQGNSAFLRRA